MTEQTTSKDNTTCCIVGGGPAGVMLGYLLARQGVDVLVLEKHKDFFRDFRGDTIHPSTLELMHELGLLEDFLKQPHQKMNQVDIHFGDRHLHVGDFTHLPTHCKYIAFMPQWDFLKFLCDHAKKLPNFRIRMEAEVNELVFENNKVCGVKAHTPDGVLEVNASVVFGTDGRHSTVRDAAQLEVIDRGAPIDVLWFRIAKNLDDPKPSFGYVNAGQFMVLIDREEYWQCAYVIRKGDFTKIQQNGIAKFHDDLAKCAPFLKSHADEIKSWDDVKLLSVAVDHLQTWYAQGLLCIGDSAHAMSPVGGIGINLAIQDAVAAARILAPALLAKTVTIADFKKVQQRRSWPTFATQLLQVFLHTHLLERIFNSPTLVSPPFFMELTERIPFLRRILARIIGMGFRPEHM